MRALVVGHKQARSEFLAGWLHASGTAAAQLRGFDELAADHPALSLLSAPKRVLATSSTPPFGATAAFSSALTAIAQLPKGEEAIVLAGPTSEHDGGAGAFTALSSQVREQLALRAAHLTVATLADTPLLGLFSRSQQLCDGAEAQLAAHADQQITEFISAANLPGTVPQLLRLAREPGTASAGGVAFILAALGASMLPARHVFARRYHWQAQIESAEVVIVLTSADSAEIAVDPLLGDIAALASDGATPCAVVATDHHLPRRAFASIGVSDLYTRGQRSWYEMGVALAQTWR